MSDALKDYQFNEGSGLFVDIKEGNPAKLRVLTTDPLIHTDKFGNTRFAFVVYNWTEEKAQILDKGASIAKPIQKIHVDEDFGADIQKVDIKITATGTGKETEYTVNVMPESKPLTKEIIDEVKAVDLEEVIKSGTRMSAVNQGESVPDEVRDNQVDETFDETEEVDLTDIPF